MIVVLSIVILILAFIALYQGIVIRTISLSTHLHHDEVVRAVVISDLHNTRYGTNQKTLIAKIKSCHPDLILLVGDMIEDQHNSLATEQFFCQVTKIAPCYFCTGNHEVRSVNMDIHQIKQWLRVRGVIVLENTSELICIRGKKLLLSGIDDPGIYQKKQQDECEHQAMTQAFASVKTQQNAYRILLAHHPERVGLYQKFGFDCIVSGHAHGGQVRIPGLINGLYAPNQGFFPRYAGGVYQVENTTLIVCRGLCIRAWLPRIFNPPEIVELIVK